MYIHTKLAKYRQRDLLSAASRDCLAAQFRYPDTVTSDQTATCPARPAWRPCSAAPAEHGSSGLTARANKPGHRAAPRQPGLSRRCPIHEGAYAPIPGPPSDTSGPGIHGHVQRCGV